MGLITNIDTMHPLGNEFLHTIVQKVHTLRANLHTFINSLFIFNNLT